MASEQAPLGTTAKTSDAGEVPPTQEKGGDMVDATSEQAPLGTTTTTTSDAGEVPPAQEKGGNNIDATSEQAPLGTANANTSDPGALPSQGQDLGGSVNNRGAVADESFDTRAKNTKDQVVGTFQKLLDGKSYKGTDTSESGAPAAGLGGGKRAKQGAVDDDSIETQMRNTGAQVVGTFQGLSSSLKLAGQKIKGAKDGVSSESK